MATADQLARLKAVVPAAQAAQRRWHVPSSVTLAQWMTESTWGSSQLALKANNFFGIKASHLAAPETYVEFPTAEYEAGKRVIVEALFAKYPTEEASFDDHARLLATASRYATAMKYEAHPRIFAIDLQIAHYSTNPQYASQLLILMREHGLFAYDLVKPAANDPQKEDA